MPTTRTIKLTGPVHGTMSVPGSKSLANRALVCAALARGVSSLRNASDSTDTAMMINGLNQLGVLARPSGDQLQVEGTGGKLYAPRFPIPVGNAGTTLRFLLSVAARAEGVTHFEGSERMGQRPITDLTDAFRQLGISMDHREGIAHYAVHGGGFKGGDVTISGEKSSQFVSSLLLAAPGVPQGLTVHITGTLASAPYLAMSLDVMNHFGVNVESSGASYRVAPGTCYRPAAFDVEPDASGATYAFGAAAIAGGEVSVPGMKRTTLQSDAALLDVLERMGCTVTWHPEGVTVGRKGSLRGIDVDMNRMPDAVPTLAAVALFAGGPTHIFNVAHLRYKESDRLGALAGELRQLGADITVHDDGMTIRPIWLNGAVLDTHEDHRLAMSFALIGLRIPGITILGPECVSKSYPRFWEELDKLTSTRERSSQGERS
jgi:3-phosphoshikimate 1-carboxyvinyltransferase